jgi:hypothetical protein
MHVKFGILSVSEHCFSGCGPIARSNDNRRRRRRRISTNDRFRIENYTFAHKTRFL